MIVLLAVASALLVSLIALFLDIFILKILLSVLIAASLVLNLLQWRKNRGAGPQDYSGTPSCGDLNDENRRLAARLRETENTAKEIGRQKNETDKRMEVLLEDVSFLCSALPLMKKLAELVIVKTEESAMNLTENIFSISSRSSQVGGHISRYLNDLFSGDKSLKTNIEILSREMKRIDSLIEDFSAINKRYTVDMKHIEENVKTINGFLSGIRDVSDRTGLLAINSSIEAARVGTAGKGFSVLAGEIQGLASSSRDLSLQIDEVVAGISERVEESFKTLETEIKVTLDELNQTRRDLREISESLDGKIGEVENHVKESDVLSKTVTEELNRVSVNMQYQDITRQILEHVMDVLNYYRVRLEEKEPVLIAESDSRVKKEKILEKASSFFTIEEEWNLFGMKMNSKDSQKKGSGEGFKGDVELF